MELTQEDLKNMDPEELSELQKKNCIFCHIISGKVASKKIYEDDICLAALDINPANPGHILLLPKDHYMIMPQLPDDIIQHLFMVAKSLSNACLKALKAQGTNIFVTNGLVAGQRAQHFMIHIVPRMENDGLKNFDLLEKDISQQEVFDVLRKKIHGVLGIKTEELPKQEQPTEAPPPEEPSKEILSKKDTPKEEPKEDKKEPADLDSIADMFIKK